MVPKINAGDVWTMVGLVCVVGFALWFDSITSRQEEEQQYFIESALGLYNIYRNYTNDLDDIIIAFVEPKLQNQVRILTGERSHFVTLRENLLRDQTKIRGYLGIRHNSSGNKLPTKVVVSQLKTEWNSQLFLDHVLHYWLYPKNTPVVYVLMALMDDLQALDKKINLTIQLIDDLLNFKIK